MAQPGKDKQQGGKIEGEGSYTGAKQYNDATREFVEEGKVEDAAAKATPKSAEEAKQMEEAEREGRSHAKEEDPALRGRKQAANE